MTAAAGKSAAESTHLAPLVGAASAVSFHGCLPGPVHQDPVTVQFIPGKCRTSAHDIQVLVLGFSQVEGDDGILIRGRSDRPVITAAGRSYGNQRTHGQSA